MSPQPWVAVAVQSWSEIRVDLTDNWWLYLSMPFVAALIGYVTKIVALEMLYRPLEFCGIGFIGWQGLVPRRAGKVASITMAMLTENLLKPEEILDRIDVREAVEALGEPLGRLVEDVSREVIDDLHPGLWESLPPPARLAVTSAIQARAPALLDEVLAHVRSDVPRYLDLEFLTISMLVQNKRSLNALMRQTAGATLGFIRRSGIYFGLAIGLVQLVAWALFHNVWIMPVFGFLTGFLSDWLALTLLFVPRHPRRFLGRRVQGVLHTKREEITRDYARLMATDLLSPERLMLAVLSGPGAPLFSRLIEQEVHRAVDEQLGVTRPVVRVLLGTRRYDHLKSVAATGVLSRLSQTMQELTPYAESALDLEHVIADKMSRLSNEQFEAIMRPIFKDDEWLMISVGAVLGALVGELQVHLITHFGAV